MMPMALWPEAFQPRQGTASKRTTRPADSSFIRPLIIEERLLCGTFFHQPFFLFDNWPWPRYRSAPLFNNFSEETTMLKRLFLVVLLVAFPADAFAQLSRGTIWFYRAADSPNPRYIPSIF